MTQTVVFLDIDGAVQSMRSSVAGFKSDPVAVTVINEWLQKPNVVTVLASTVRILCKTAEQAKEILQKKYGLEGMTFHENFRTGATVLIEGDDQSMSRRQELLNWLQLHRNEQDRYYAIDDETLNIEGVTHIQATHDGLSMVQLCQILHIAGSMRKREHDSWHEFDAKMFQMEAIKKGFIRPASERLN